MPEEKDMQKQFEQMEWFDPNEDMSISDDQAIIDANEASKERLSRNAGEVDQFKAFDALEWMDLTSEEALETGVAIDPESLASSVISQAKDGTLKDSLTNVYNTYDNKLIAETQGQLLQSAQQVISGKATLESKIDEIKSFKDIIATTSPEIIRRGLLPLKAQPEFITRLQDKKTGKYKFIHRRDLERVTRENWFWDDDYFIENILPGRIIPGTISAHVSDYFFDDVAIGQLNKSQRKHLDMIASYQALLMKGLSVKEIEKLNPGNLEQPIIEPASIISDILTGAITYKLGIALTSKATMRSTIGREVLFGGIAGGFMTLADMTGAGPVISAISGLLGPVASTGLFLTSRKGLSLFLSGIKDRNKTIYQDLLKIADKYKDHKLGSVIKETANQLEIGEITVPSKDISIIAQSPMSIAARNAHITGDENATHKIGEAVITALTGGEQVSTLVKKACGTGDVTHTTIIPKIRTQAEKDAGIESINHIPDATLLEGHEELATYFRNSFDIRDTIAHNEVHKRLAENDKMFPDMVRATVFRDQNTIHFGAMAKDAQDKFFTGKLGKGRRVWQPTATFGDFADFLVKIPSALFNFQRSMAKSGQDIVDKHIYNNLTKDEISDLDNLFRHATDLDEEFKVVEGGLYSNKTDKTYFCSDKLIDRFYKGRFLMDASYEAANSTAIQVATQQGYKQLDDGFICRVFKKARKDAELQPDATDIDGVVWTKEKQKEGWVAAQIVDPKNPKAERHFKFLSPAEVDTRLRDIDTRVELLPRRPGYTPIRIKKEAKRYFITRIYKDLKTNEWRFSKIAGARTQPNGVKLVQELRKNDKESKYVVHRSIEEANAVDFTLDKDMSYQLRRMRKDELDEFIIGLRRSDIPEEEVDAIIRYAQTFGFNKRMPFKSRGTHRLHEAESLVDEIKKAEGNLKLAYRKAAIIPLEPTRAAMGEYMGEVSKFINMSVHNDKMVSSFMEKYAKKLGLTDWNETIDFKKLKDKPFHIRQLAEEAVEVQSQIRRALDVPTDKQHKAQMYWQNKADKWYQGKFKFVGTFIDKHLQKGLQYAGSDFLKKMGLVNKLGMFNWSQMLMQPTVILNAMKYAAIDPRLLRDGVSDFMAAYMEAMVGKKLKLPVSKEAQYFKDLIDKSGMNVGINLDYADKIMRQTTGWKTKATAVPGAIIRAGLTPLRGGEATGRGIIWFTERRNLIREIEQGRHPVFNRADIDTDEFLLDVNIRTNNVAGDFSKYNKAFLTRDGWLSAATQFWSYPIFQTQFMVFEKMTPGQRAAVWGAWCGAFGLEGVPFIWDAITLGEQAVERGKHPEAIGSTRRFILSLIKEEMDEIITDPFAKRELINFAQRFVTEGMIPALSDGEMNWASRAGVARIVNNFIDGLSYDDLYGPGFNTIVGLIGGGIEGTKDLLTYWKNNDFNRVAATSAVIKGTKEITGISGMLKATMPEIHGETNPSLFDRLQQFVSVRPGEPVALSKRKMDATRYGVAFRDFYWDEAKRIVEMSKHAPNSGQQQLIETINFIGQQNPLGIGPFLKAHSQIWSAQSLPPELRTQFIELKKGLDSGIFPK